MRCEEMRDLLDLYMDGELPDETAQRLSRHLLRCTQCASEMQALEQTRSMLREAVPVSETSLAFRERTTARLLDAFAAHLRPVPDAVALGTRQWTLPFPREEKASERNTKKSA